MRNWKTIRLHSINSYIITFMIIYLKNQMIIKKNQMMNNKNKKNKKYK